MPRTFCWTTPVDKYDYVRTGTNMHWVHAVIQSKDVQKQRGMHCVWGGEDLWNVLFKKTFIQKYPKQLRKL